MLNFEFENQTKLIFGKGQLEKIKNEIPKYGKRVLVTYGGGSIKAFGLYDKVMATLKEMDVEVFEFAGIEPNPRIETARRAIALCKEKKIDFILAVGGGSVIDCTKLIAAGSGYDGDAWDIVINKHCPETVLPFGTVLTLAATGSEMNTGSVITNWETKEKYGWGRPPLTFPRFSVLDPENTYTVPLDQTINGIVDMMSHVYEQYFHHVPNTYLQDEMCEGLLRTVIGEGPKLCRELDNYDYRETILYCGTIALNGYLRVGGMGDWATHNIEHAVSAVYDIPHGAGLAILFPNWMKHVMHENIARFKHFAIAVYHVDPVGKTDEEIALEGINCNQAFWKSLGAPTKLSECGIDDSQLDLLVEKAMVNGPFGNFKKLTADDVRAILQASM